MNLPPRHLLNGSYLGYIGSSLKQKFILALRAMKIRCAEWPQGKLTCVTAVDLAPLVWAREAAATLSNSRPTGEGSSVDAVDLAPTGRGKQRKAISNASGHHRRPAKTKTRINNRNQPNFTQHVRGLRSNTMSFKSLLMLSTNLRNISINV
jgi:hypothetical protein